LRADVALLHAHAADCFGNLRFAASARNFNPLMAMAADNVLVEIGQLLPLFLEQPEMQILLTFL